MTLPCKRDKYNGVVLLPTHNMIERDGKTWYWCNNHRYNNRGVVTQGMYFFHKPGSEHDAWQAKKD